MKDVANEILPETCTGPAGEGGKLEDDSVGDLCGDVGAASRRCVPGAGAGRHVERSAVI